MIKPITLDVHWCIGIQYTYNNNSFVILNVYTPYEICENEEEYLSRLALINAFVQDNSTYSIYVVGDFNADLSDGSSRQFANHLIYFCEDAYLILSSKVLLPRDSHTYISEAWHTTSWLDHCISTAGNATLENMTIKYRIAVSDYINFAFTVNVEELPAKIGNNHVTNNTTSVKLDWSAFMNMTSWPVLIRQINI